MKHLLLFVFFLVSFNLPAQQKLVGFSESGEINAPNSGGMIWEMNPDGTGFNVLKNFQMQKPILFRNKMVVGPDGKGYGFASGYNYDQTTQVLYQYDFETKTFSIIRFFRDSLWNGPFIFGTDGMIYGCRRISSNLTLWKMSPDGADLSPVDETDGNPVPIDILQIPDGQIVVFSWLGGIRVRSGSPDGSGWKDLVVINGDFNNYFVSNVVRKSDGNLYFAVWPGAGNSNVRFYKVNPNTQDYSVFYETPESDFGKNISLGLGANDALFILGVGSFGQVAYKMTQDTTPPVQIFLDNTHGYNNTPLAVEANGDLYFTSTTSMNFSQSAYNIYLFRIDGSNAGVQLTDSLKHNNKFNITPLVAHPTNGKLYFWQTSDIFVPPVMISCPTDSPKLTIEYVKEDKIPEEGAYLKKLIKGSDGKYYGFMLKGGANNSGVVFRVNPNGTDFQAICSFPPTVGYINVTYSLSCFFEGSDGWLYGTVGDGRIFRVNKDGTGFTYILSDLSYNCNFIEMPDGMLYWGGASLKRMAKDGSNKSTVISNYLNKFTTRDFCELFKLPDGTRVTVGSYTEGSWPHEFTRRVIFKTNPGGGYINNLQASCTTVGNDGVLYLNVGKYNPGSVGLTEYDIQCGNLPDVYTNQPAQARFQGSNGNIFGQRYVSPMVNANVYSYAYGSWFAMAWSPENGVCQMETAWNPGMGYAGHFAFERTSSTPTVQSELDAPGIQLIPNPTSSTTQLVARVQTLGPGTLRVVDMMGRVILAQSVLLNIGENRIEIPGSALNTKGMYQVMLQTKEGVSSQVLSVN